jgi:hypothetical protein
VGNMFLATPHLDCMMQSSASHASHGLIGVHGVVTDLLLSAINTVNLTGYIVQSALKFHVFRVLGRIVTYFASQVYNLPKANSFIDWASFDLFL